ncbi:MAG: amino acid permease, partial [Bacillota bacterium]|nr:amino acid permease [Bacillota bacterium]
MELKRVLTLRTIVSMSAGLALASSTFVAMLQVATFVAGESAWIAILVAGLLALTAAFSFGEMNGMYPSAAAIRVYLSKGYNDTLSLIVSFLYILIILAVLGTEAFILSQALAYAIPAVPALVWNIALLILVTLLNLRGLTLAGKFQDVVTYGLVLSLAGTSILAFTRPEFQLQAALHPGSFDGFLQAVALGVFLYIGFEWVTPLSEEVTQVRLVPKGMMLALGLLGVTYALTITAFTGTVDKALLASVPIPQILFGEKLLGSAGVLWMLLLSLAATTKTFNAGFT